MEEEEKIKRRLEVHLHRWCLPLLLDSALVFAAIKAASLLVSGPIVVCRSQASLAAAPAPPATPAFPARRPVKYGFRRGSKEAIARFEAWDKEFGWSGPARPDADTKNTTAWPPVRGIPGGWSLEGLLGPLVYVVSMPARSSRRNRFAKLFRGLSLSTGFEWAPVVDGQRIPPELRWMRGLANATAWDRDRPDVWAYYVTHLAIMREALARCAHCDLVVFEDDVVFQPSFLRHWAAFLKEVPPDWAILHLGARSQSEPPFEVSQHYVRSASVSNTWGYVVRSSSLLQLADWLAELPARDSGGVDAAMQLFTKELTTYIPVMPMVLAASVSDGTRPVKAVNDLEDAASSLLQNWPQGYTRAYCLARGKLGLAHQDTGTCRGHEFRDRCCPYVNPPPKPQGRSQFCKFVKGIFAVHIVKTAGSSLIHDIHKVLPPCSTFVSIETCFGALEKRSRGHHEGVISMVRVPRNQVYSEYLHCKHYGPARALIPTSKRHVLQNFTKWLTHFKGGSEPDDLNCYHPFNLQTRFLSCNDGRHWAPHHLPGSHGNPEEVPNAFSVALANLERATVGLTERYQESLCLIAAKVAPGQDLPAFCNCADSIAWRSFSSKRVNYGAPKHSLKDLSATQLKLIDELTRVDVQLYDAVKQRFEREVRKVEQAHRVKILC